MRLKFFLSSAAIALSSTVLFTSFLPAQTADAQPAAPVFIRASDPRFAYEGRFDFTAGAAPIVVWQASRIRIDFEGDSVALNVDEVHGQNFFDVVIDGKASIAGWSEGKKAEGNEFTGLGAGRHRLMLFKRSEAAAGTVRFRGISIASDAQAFAPTLPHYRIAFQFFGDSITAGACNEDGKEDQWDDRRTHNNALSYGAFTATAFQADYRNIAVSGMGIVTGYVPMRAGEIWDRLQPDVKSPRADLSTWTPNVVFVNYGENDDSFTGRDHQPFPSAEFTKGYVALVQAIRAAYPKAEIVALRGGMFGGAKSERLRGPWEAAVQQLEAKDPHVSHFVFKHWTGTHPRVSDHRAMADELVTWLETQAFMDGRR
jgi:lysophospholipase L1-like esterase